MKILRKEDLVKVGFVNKTSGFKGNVSCITEINKPEKLYRSKFLFLILEGLPVPFAVETIEVKGNELIIKFEDVDSEQVAKKLLRKEIYADKFKEGKKIDLISWNGLLDYTVIDTTSGVIGKIEEVLEFPMQIIAKCLVNGKEVLFPLNDEIVIEIDEEEKKVFVDLPDGLLNVYLL